MIIRAFGTGMKLESGYYNVGWQGFVPLAIPVRWGGESDAGGLKLELGYFRAGPLGVVVNPVRWRPPVAAGRPVYSSAPVKQMLWEVV